MYRGFKYDREPQPDIDVGSDNKTMGQTEFENTVQLLVLKNSQGAAPGRVIAQWRGETVRVF